MSDDADKNAGTTGSNPTRAELKKAADALLKASPPPSEGDGFEADSGEHSEAAEQGDEPLELTPEHQIMALEIEKEELKDQLLRTLAEAQNIRKRAEREQADARIYAVEKFARDLLSVSDNMARALDALPEAERSALTEAGQSLLGGIEMTQNELHTVLARHGVKTIEAEPGSAFDPNLHQAISQIPSAYPQGMIAASFQSGWQIGDRILRAAMVAVSIGAPAQAAEDDPVS